MKIFITILFMMSTVIISAQEKTITTESKKITGVITDSQGMPIPGATVTIAGTSGYVQADFDGIYVIESREGDKLVASFVGMVQETITISKQTTIDFKLQETTPAIKPIVAPDTHAVKSITSLWEIKKKPNSDFQKLLQEQAWILSIEHPKANNIVIFRCYGSINGPSEPLYVIDGVPLNADNFKQLNPDDILSINVLKDTGATSIYGNRGADGVIIVKTKNSLTKKEKRKLKREQKKKDKTTTN